MIGKETLDTLYSPLYDEFLQMGQRKATVTYNLICEKVHPTLPEWRTSDIGTVGRWEAYDKTSPVPEGDVKKGFTQTFQIGRFGKVLTVHDEDLKFTADKAAVFFAKKPDIFNMGTEGELTKEYDFNQIFVNAFNPAFVGPDGVSLGSDAHPICDGSATMYSNKISSVLSMDGLSDALLCASQMLNHNSDIVPGWAQRFLNEAYLMVGPALWPLAQQLWVGDWDPESTERTPNIYKGRFKVIVNSYLVGAASNYWFLLLPHWDFREVVWEEAHFTSYVDERRELYLFQAVEKYQIGWVGARGTICSQV